MGLCPAAEKKGMTDWKMTFNTRNFHKGLNVSFRNGNDKYVDMIPGDTILMCDKFGGVIGNSRVLGTEVLNIKQWQHQVEYLMRFEPDPRSRDLVGWMQTMDTAYGKGQWGPVVTAVLFWVD